MMSRSMVSFLTSSPNLTRLPSLAYAVVIAPISLTPLSSQVPITIRFISPTTLSDFLATDLLLDLQNISCSFCPSLCMGQTGRHLTDPFAEYLRNIRLGDNTPVSRYESIFVYMCVYMRVCVCF